MVMSLHGSVQVYRFYYWDIPLAKSELEDENLQP